MEGHDGVEQAIDGEAARVEVDAEIAGQEQVGLPRFDGDAGRDTAAVEIPGVGMNVVFGDDAAAKSAKRLALDGQDAIHEHQRFVGQADARRVGVDCGEVGAEDAGDGADGELQTLLADRGAGAGEQLGRGRQPAETVRTRPSTPPAQLRCRRKSLV